MATPTNPELNSLTTAQLVAYGFPDKIAGRYIGFKKLLGGFARKEQILEIYGIDKTLAQKLIDEATLNTEQLIRINLEQAEESVLKRHPYFKPYADQIIFLRISHPQKEQILKKLKAKPKDLEKMNWYLE